MTAAAALAPETIFAIANIGLLTGIFFRLGGLTKAHDDFVRRLNRLEGEKA